MKYLIQLEKNEFDVGAEESGVDQRTAKAAAKGKPCPLFTEEEEGGKEWEREEWMSSDVAVVMKRHTND